MRSYSSYCVIHLYQFCMWGILLFLAISCSNDFMCILLAQYYAASNSVYCLAVLFVYFTCYQAYLIKSKKQCANFNNLQEPI